MLDFRNWQFWSNDENKTIETSIHVVQINNFYYIVLLRFGFEYFDNWSNWFEDCRHRHEIREWIAEIHSALLFRLNCALMNQIEFVCSKQKKNFSANSLKFEIFLEFIGFLLYSSWLYSSISDNSNVYIWNACDFKWERLHKIRNNFVKK